MQTRRGVTLIEMLVVFAIFGGVCLLAIWIYSFTGSALESSLVTAAVPVLLMFAIGAVGALSRSQHDDRQDVEYSWMDDYEDGYAILLKTSPRDTNVVRVMWSRLKAKEEAQQLQSGCNVKGWQYSTEKCLVQARGDRTSDGAKHDVCPQCGKVVG